MAHRIGLCDREITVHMPGGDVRVHVGDTMTLQGPSAYIASIDVPA